MSSNHIVQCGYKFLYVLINEENVHLVMQDVGRVLRAVNSEEFYPYRKLVIRVELGFMPKEVGQFVKLLVAGLSQVKKRFKVEFASLSPNNLTEPIHPVKTKSRDFDGYRERLRFFQSHCFLQDALAPETPVDVCVNQKQIQQFLQFYEQLVQRQARLRVLRLVFFQDSIEYKFARAPTPQQMHRFLTDNSEINVLTRHLKVRLEFSTSAQLAPFYQLVQRVLDPALLKELHLVSHLARVEDILGLFEGLRDVQRLVRFTFAQRQVVKHANALQVPQALAAFLERQTRLKQVTLRLHHFLLVNQLEWANCFQKLNFCARLQQVYISCSEQHFPRYLNPQPHLVSVVEEFATPNPVVYKNAYLENLLQFPNLTHFRSIPYTLQLQKHAFGPQGLHQQLQNDLQFRLSLTVSNIALRRKKVAVLLQAVRNKLRVTALRKEIAQQLVEQFLFPLPKTYDQAFKDFYATWLLITPDYANIF